jgi:broad specificity phosphatase PhoE
MITRLLLVRHGETTWNVEGRYQGQADPPLSERGRAQAEATAQKLADQGLQVLYSSPLRRASETAQIIALRLGLSVGYDPRLMEINQGEWEGMLVTDIEQHWPALFSRWVHDPWLVTLPGGESLSQLQMRVLAAVADMVARHPEQRIGVVTHKMPIAIIKIHRQGLEPERIWELFPANAAWEEVQIGSHLLAKQDPRSLSPVEKGAKQWSM